MDRRRFLTTVGTGAAVGVAGCVQAPQAEPEETTTGGTATTTQERGTATETTAGGGGAPNTVDMVTENRTYYFDPIGLFVEPGETVEWVIASGTHSSAAYESGSASAGVTRIPEGADAWNSGILGQQGASFDHTFETTGTYDYFCLPHKSLGMVARVVVGEPGGVEGNPPDGKVPSEQAIVERGAIPYDEFTG